MVRHGKVGSTDVLHVSGEIDLATIPALHNALIRFSNEHPGAGLVVDLDGVSACDDSGLGVLLGAAGRLRDAAGDLVVVCNDPSLRIRLARTGFDRAVNVVASIEP
jgi:anti-sigma B factor antagonist